MNDISFIDRPFAPPLDEVEPTAVVVYLAGTPAGKGRPRFSFKTGTAYTPAKTVRYESDLKAAAQNTMNGRRPMDGALKVRVVAYMPIPASWSKKRRQQAFLGVIRPTTRPDWENIAKMLDAFNQVVWADDRQVVQASFAKWYSEKPGLRVEVEAV